MKCMVIKRPNDLHCMDRAIPEPGLGEILIQVMASGICGTDLHIYRGEYMGDYPVIPGHEFSGLVAATGSQVTRFSPGDRVAVEPNIACDNCFHCLHNRQNFCENWKAIGVTLPGGMAQYVVVPEKAAFGIGNLPFEQGAFVEPLSCVIHGIEKTRIDLASQVAILGAGPIGSLMLQVARLQGAAHITTLESNPGRVATASQLGADQVATRIEDLASNGYDVVIDATGSIPVMSRAIDFARHGGTVLFFGVPPVKKMMEIEAFEVFRKGLTLISSFTSVRNSIQAVNLLQAGMIQVLPLISHRLPLEELSRGLEMMETRNPTVRKVIIQPNN